MLIAVCSPETATAGKGAHFQLVALVVHVMPGLTTHDTHILSICAVSSGCFSIFASFTMSSIILILPTTRSIMSSRLVLYLCTSDMLWIASVVYGSAWSLATGGTLEISTSDDSLHIPEIGCIISGFTLQWFITCSDLMAVSIAVFLFATSVLKIEPWAKMWFTDPVFIVCVYLPTLIVAIIPFFGVGGGYGPAGTWCWVSDPTARFLFAYTFHWGSLLLMSIFYSLSLYFFVRATKVARRVYVPVNSLEARTRNARFAAFKRLLPFPLVFAIMIIPATINRIQNFVDPDNPILLLYVLHVSIIELIGAANALLYLWTHFHLIKTGFENFSFRQAFTHWSPVFQNPSSLDFSDPKTIPLVSDGYIEPEEENE